MFDHEFHQAGEPGAATSKAPRLWDAIARAAYELDDARPVPAVDGRQLAQVIAQHAPARAYYAEIERAFAALASELRHDHGPDGEQVRRRIAELTSALQQDLLRALLAASGDVAHRRDFLDDAAAAFTVDALLRVLLAAAAEAEFEMSRPLVRILYKLAIQTRMGPPELRAHAEVSLREQVRALIARWWIVQQHSYGFDQMYHGELEGSALAPEPERMIHMALEVDAVGLPIWGPVTQLLADGRSGELTDLLRAAPAESRAARAIVEYVATPQRLASLLAEDEVDFALVDRMVDYLGEAAAPLLLDRLATAESRAVRRGVFDRLARLGGRIGPLAWSRLNDRRWFVQRNVLALLGELQYWPEGAPMDEWVRHRDPRLRKEAVRALLRMPKHRERALAQTLRDETDRQTLRTALAVALERVPESVVPVIVKRLDDGTLPPDLRVAAVRLLRSSRSALALEALLRLVEGGRSMIGRTKLAPKSSDMLAALRALAAAWPTERRAAAVLERARSSRDADIARAAAGEGDTADALPAETEDPAV